ncbi:MAG TPA: FadR/GntR family transcriptional regulator [Acidimicrobiales bacterium]|nr:FadR/GntR family transcriptional regulator [Acidimicrobiales bacterium]
MTTPSSPPARGQVAYQLEREIMDENLAVGTKLASERELALRFGVSRPLVREALRSLVERGLIEVAPGRGAFVRHRTNAEAARPLDSHYRRQRITPEHLIEARMIIEPAAARLAALRASEDEVEVLREAVERLEHPKDILDRVRCDVALHVLIARSAHNPVIETTFESIVSLVSELALRTSMDAKATAASAPYHRAVYEAIRDRDPDRASEAMRAHHLSGGQLYGKDFTASLDRLARRELQRLLGHRVSSPQDVVAEIMGKPTSPAGVQGS